jgi:hypothetical protein
MGEVNKYVHSNIRNPPLETSQLYKNIFFTNGSPMKNDGFFKTSQLNINGEFAYI